MPVKGSGSAVARLRRASVLNARHRESFFSSLVGAADEP